MTKTRTPTAEQASILHDARVHRDEGRKIEAFAGTGKTSTLEMLAHDRKDRGCYLAFNRAIKDEATGRFPAHIKVTTAHGAAFQALKMYEQKARFEHRIYPDTVGQFVRLPRSRMPEDALGFVVLETITNFCNSAEENLELLHVALSPNEPEDIRMAALEGTRSLWRRMSNPKDDCPITHDVYLKLWQLGDASMPGVEWVLFDEAQDASPVMIDVMNRLDIPITWVGDNNQSIYAFRGAVNAMRLMPGRVFPLSRSFRFGDEIAQAANMILACKPEELRPQFQIEGNPNRDSHIGRLSHNMPYAFLARTNAEWFQEGLRTQARVHVIGGLEETARLLEGAWQLWRNGVRANRVPSLARFTKWKDLCDHTDKFQDRELTFSRKIIEQYREQLPVAINNLRQRHTLHEADAHIVLSTAHKAKGKEFQYVKLGNGFANPNDPEWKKMTTNEQEAEINLLYVALTRAIDGVEPNQAVLASIAIAKGEIKPGQNLVARPLTLIPTKEVKVTPEVVIKHVKEIKEIKTVKPPRLKAKEVTPRVVLEPVDHKSSIKQWTPEEDQEIMTMMKKGFEPIDIAEWVDRSHIAIVVRLAVLESGGRDVNLNHAILSALTPPAPVSTQIILRKAKKSPTQFDLLTIDDSGFEVTEDTSYPGMKR